MKALRFFLPLLLAFPSEVPSEWKLSPAPIVTIGGDGRAETEFFRVVRAWRLSDGAIAVVNAGSKEIRVFDARGAWLHSFGRDGEGPGEFRQFGWSGHSGDTAVFYDGNLRRITTILLGGAPSLVAVLPITVREERSFDVVGKLADGRWLVHAVSPPNVRAPGVQRVPGFTGLIDRKATGTVEWLAEQPDLSLFVYNPAGNQKLVSIVITAFPASFAAVASGTTIWLGDTGTGELVKIDAATGARSAIRLPDASPRLSKAIVDAARKGELEGARDQASRDMVEAKYSARYLPKRLPAFETLVAGPGGEVWVQRFALSRNDPAQYAVVTPNGQVLARVSVPPGFRVTDIGHDYVVGVHKDGDGVETVRAYTLTRR